MRSEEANVSNAEELKGLLRGLFSSQRLAVLATQEGGRPYGSLVAYAATEDLKYLFFATSRATRKYHYLSRNPQVAMVVDDRSNMEADFHKAIAATATGAAKEVEGSEKEKALGLYLAKHPHLKEFVTAPTCALLRLEVETYYIVSRFQNVMLLDPRK